MKYNICDITFFAIAETQIPRDLTLRRIRVFVLWKKRAKKEQSNKEIVRNTGKKRKKAKKREA